MCLGLDPLQSDALEEDKWRTSARSSCAAVHIEVIESMDASSCINALRRFFSLGGPAKQLWSDCGTNFIGACRELGMDKAVQRYLGNQGCSWNFVPHASHIGGLWEHMIGVARSILDSMFLQKPPGWGPSSPSRQASYSQLLANGGGYCNMSGRDGFIRKVEVKTIDQGTAKTFPMPGTKLVLLLQKDWQIFGGLFIRNFRF